MIASDAEALVEFVDATWKMDFANDDYGHERWLEFFKGQEDAGLMMAVLQKVAARQRDRATIGDVRNALNREGVTADQEDEFERAMPAWVKVWLIARAKGDDRTLAEQHPGMQAAPPGQTLMPDDARAEYAAQAARLGAGLHSVFEQVVTG